MRLSALVVAEVTVTGEKRIRTARGHAYRLGQIPDVTESFYAIVQKRRFPNQLLVELLEPSASAAGDRLPPAF